MRKKLSMRAELAVAHVFLAHPSRVRASVRKTDVIFERLTYADLLPSLREAEQADVCTVREEGDIITVTLK